MWVVFFTACAGSFSSARVNQGSLKIAADKQCTFLPQQNHSGNAVGKQKQKQNQAGNTEQAETPAPHSSLVNTVYTFVEVVRGTTAQHPCL
jgi:hypothetical protein